MSILVSKEFRLDSHNKKKRIIGEILRIKEIKNKDKIRDKIKVR